MSVALINLLIMALAIYVLAIITDEFFVISLDQIAQKWKLPNSVAGASLMAIGSSAPELAIAMFSLFKEGGAHSDVGIGTIVGSAVFNILVITGISAIVRPARVTWLVAVRDCLIYTASIILLLVVFADGTITMLESFAFLGLYTAYIFILFQWDQFVPGEGMDVPDLVHETVEVKLSGSETNLFQTITKRVEQLIGFLAGDAHKSYIRAFLVSVLFIAGLSWVLVDSAVLFAEAVGIPPVIVALTILAGGTSVPDLISSVIVARQGRGEMAVANAVGSNIFDVLVGLGLPWLIAMVFQGAQIHVGTENLWLSVLILLATVVILFVFLTTHRLLSRFEGWILLLVYAGYVVWTWLGGG